MAAANLDITRGVADRLPLFFGGVLLVSFLLLMMVFRSVVVPLKAVVMNLLASAAAFGVLTLAVSGGPLGDLVGIPEATPVPILLPIGIFAILFGLSMDYEVFLLSRIKEEYDRTGDNALAVADGLAKSARVITAGAAVMVTVFLSFALGVDVYGKMFGIGLAAAVLIDATIVRMVLVPATMELLGDRNWWLPGWLDRLLPNIDVEGHDVTDGDLGTPGPPPASTRRRSSPGAAYDADPYWRPVSPPMRCPTITNPHRTTPAGHAHDHRRGRHQEVRPLHRGRRRQLHRPAGRVTGFLGPNGAGKSTTMRVMVGLTRPRREPSPSPGASFVDLPNPGLEVGVLLDASAQHAGRTGREILAIAQQFMGLPATAGRGDARARQPHPDRGGPAGRQLLPRDASTARHRHRPDRRPRGADPRRARQRPRPGRHPLDARPAPRLRRPRRHRPALLPPAARDRGHRRRHRDDRQRPDRLPGHQDRPAARRRHGRPRRQTSPRSSGRSTSWGLAATPPDDGALRTDADAALVGKVALEAGVALTELRAADGAGLEEMFLELTATTQRDGGHRMTAIAAGRRPRTGRGAADRVPLTRVTKVELRKMFDTRSGFWLIASIAITAVLATVGVILLAPDGQLTYSTFATAIRFPVVDHPAAHRDPGGHQRVEPAHRPDHVHARPAPQPRSSPPRPSPRSSSPSPRWR